MNAAARRPTWEALIAVTAAAVGLRAALMAAQDGYAAAGLWGVAAHGFGRDVADGLLFAGPVALLVGVALRRSAPEGARRGLRWAAWLLLAVLIDLFVVGVVPGRPLHVPGWSSRAGQLAHAGAALGSLALAGGVTLLAGRVGRGLSALALTALALALSGLWATGTRGDVPDVVLISLDTLRPDRLGCYGHDAPTSPRLDRFAARSRRFEAAFSPEPWTLTAHASLLTSLHPVTHAVGHDRRLQPVPTLASRLSDAGWITVAVVDSVVWLDRRYGLDRGFDIYRPVWGTAADKRAVVADLLDDLGNRPAFLFLHCFDAHSGFRSLPYEADEQDLELLVGGGGAAAAFGCETDPDCASDWLQALNQQGRVPSDETVARLAAYYDAGVRSLDRQVGALFDDLRSRDRFETAYLVVTADHGEEFFEHGRALHTQLFDECVAVPLLVAGPGIAPGTSDRLVSLMDIGPTLLELANLGSSLGQGTSLAPELLGTGNGGLARPPLLLVNDVDAVALRTADFKLLRRDGHFALFDLRVDPDERHDLLDGAAPPEDLSASLDEALGRARQAAEQLGTGAELEQPVLDADEVERLKALGYLGER